MTAGRGAPVTIRESTRDVTRNGSLAAHVARWDLDKTYLRTDFDTFRDLVRTAFERPDEKRTNPGAGALLREMVRAGISVHILSGSPEQMRRRLEDKLRLDGVVWDSFVLKPNLQNMLRLRFRALRDQLGYKLPALVHARASADRERARRSRPDYEIPFPRETLFGDDAEADAFVYSLYADVLRGAVSPEELAHVAELGRMYEDVRDTLAQDARSIEHSDVVERILIHLERQSPPDDFRAYGPRVIPFYNYFQAALAVFEDGRLGAVGVLSVAAELVIQHRFDGDSLARSYADLGRRGHLRGTGIDALAKAFAEQEDAAGSSWTGGGPASARAREELAALLRLLPDAAKSAATSYRGDEPVVVDYAGLVKSHNRRK
jgi:hypothetical protein